MTPWLRGTGPREDLQTPLSVDEVLALNERRPAVTGLRRQAPNRLRKEVVALDIMTLMCFAAEMFAVGLAFGLALRRP